MSTGREQATSKSRAKSKLYREYPSKTAVGAQTKDSARRGYFENLQQFVGIGIDKNCEESRCLTKDVEDGGVFCFDKDALEHMDKLNYRSGRVSLKDKQKDMLGYLWELAYDLCLAPDNNISESPGLEHPLGVHTGTSKK